MNMSKPLRNDKSNTVKAWNAPSFNTGKSNAGMAGLHTHEQNEAIKKQAYDEGFAEGHNDGLKRAQQQIQEKTNCLDSILNTLTEPLLELDEQVTAELCDLAMLVAGHIVRRELKTSPGEVIATVKEALSLLPVATGSVRLELHPQDAVTVREALSGVDAELSWNIVEDPLLTRGGCRVATNTSRIDATVETRLNATIASALGSERKLER